MPGIANTHWPRNAVERVIFGCRMVGFRQWAKHVAPDRLVVGRALQRRCHSTQGTRHQPGKFRDQLFVPQSSGPIENGAPLNKFAGPPPGIARGSVARKGTPERDLRYPVLAACVAVENGSAVPVATAKPAGVGFDNAIGVSMVFWASFRRLLFFTRIGSILE